MMILGYTHGTGTLTATDILTGRQPWELKGNGFRCQKAAVSTRHSDTTRRRGETARRGLEVRGQKSEVRLHKIAERDSILIAFLLDSNS